MDTLHTPIEHGYFDVNGQYHATDDAVFAQLSDKLTKNLNKNNDFSGALVAYSGDKKLILPDEFSGSLKLNFQDENGKISIFPIHYQQDKQAIFLLPPDLLLGYYRVWNSQIAPDAYFFVYAPKTAYTPKNKVTGLTVQLYSLHSAHDWGIGDFMDLAQLAATSGKQGIDFIGINPIHALYTSDPEFCSPYSPYSRMWLNPIYLNVPNVAKTLDLEKILENWLPEYANQIQTAKNRERVDYAAVLSLKLSALLSLSEAFFSQHHPSSKYHSQFQFFVRDKGDALAGFALFEALDNHFAAQGKSHGWTNWTSEFQHPNSPKVKQFKQENQKVIRFYMWLQWLCAIQLDEANLACLENGVSLGLYGDLAVGTALGSADTWLNAPQYCLDLSIGAPPDPFSPIGQNWQLSPLNPLAMLPTGFTEFIKMIRENMARFGVLRIDHVMALNRLWLIVGANETAAKGAYVRYPQEILFAIVALESVRHRCVVIGEDLGTVPDETRALLNQYQIFSYKVLYFHQNPSDYPLLSVACTSTHDLAPLAGWWSGADLQTMRRLGTLPNDEIFQAAKNQRETDKNQLINKLRHHQNIFRLPENLENFSSKLLSAIHAYNADTPSQLFAIQLENILQMTQNFNVPSVAQGNWALRYPISLDELARNQSFISQIALIKETRKMNASQQRYPHPDARERDTIDALFWATHGNAFAYLGRHQMDGVGEVIRAILPTAHAVNVVERASGELITPMQKLDERGFWVCVLPKNAPDYAFTIQNEHGEYRTEDPYRYGSFLGDLDNWLLGEGKHLRPYETLGAHLKNFDGIDGGYFAVWAPNAQRVSVVGEFNAWDGRVHVMRHHQETGIWEIFIPEIAFNSLYKFEIKDANGDVRVKSDPYAFAAELRPTTASVLRGLPEKVAAPDWRQAANAIDAPIAIYEVHLGSWKQKLPENEWLTYSELATQLIDYVKEMGFTHIELLPLSEYPFDGSWGYQPTGLYAPTSRFGSPQELQALIQAAHDAGISVILDWVVGHFPTDEHGLARFDGTPLYEHADPREGYHQDWNTLIYNFGRNEVKNFLTGNALYWVERFGFDGLRVDAVASMIYRDYSRKDGEWIPNQFGGRENLEAINFLHDTNVMLQQQNLNAVSIAEESTAFPNVTRLEGLNFQYKWNMGWMNDTLRYMAEDPINRKYHHNKMTFGMMYQYSENYVLPLSHDEVVHGKGSLLAKMPGDCWQKFANLRAYYGFMYGFPGKKLLFMGNEFAQGREWNVATGLDWFLLGDEYDGWHSGVQQFVRELNHVYRANAPLYQLDQWHEGFEWLVPDDSENSVYVFERRDRDGNRVIVVSNFTPIVRENYRFGVNASGEYHIILNSDETRFKGSEIELSSSLKTENVPSHGRDQSLNMTLPPLATVYLYLPNTAENTTESSIDAPSARNSGSLKHKKHGKKNHRKS